MKQPKRVKGPKPFTIFFQERQLPSMLVGDEPIDLGAAAGGGAMDVDVSFMSACIDIFFFIINTFPFLILLKSHIRARGKTIYKRPCQLQTYFRF